MLKVFKKIKFDRQLRLSVTGMIGLALLTGTHCLRENISEQNAVLALVLGSMPNLSAAFAMPLIFASFYRSQSQAQITHRTDRSFIWIMLFTTLGLLIWELMQSSNERFVFDVNDIIATGLGAWIAYIAYVLLTKDC
ncbi:MAG: hypothetical protein Q8L06_04030 [Pseudohongiella sp.]|nr:hypothetical protein [Pseudohongiella sp.]